MSGLLGQVPTVGSMLESAASAGGLYLLGEVEKKKKEEESRNTLQSLLQLDSAQLRIITGDCAREAASRWEMAINHFIDDKKGLMLFAATGAIRILEYLCRKHLPIETSHLLMGLIMGRSGKGYLTFSNTKIPLLNNMRQHFENNEAISAESLYGRCGFIVGKEYFIHDPKAGKTAEEIEALRKKQRSEYEVHYGFVKFFKIDLPLVAQIHHKRPKAGYVQLPDANILEALAHPKTDGYSYIKHTSHSFFEERYFYNNQCKAQTRYITEKEVYEYLASIAQGKTLSLNEFIGAVAFFRGTLKGTAQQILDLSKANFAGSDFSRSTLEFCKLGNCQGLILVGATLKNIQATGDSLNSAVLDLSSHTNCDYTGLKALQTQWSYAKVYTSVFKDVLGTGMALEGTFFDEPTKASFGSDLRKEVDALAKVYEEQRLKIKADIDKNWKAIQEQAVKLASLETEFQHFKTHFAPREILLLKQLKAGQGVAWNCPPQHHLFIGRESQLKAIEAVFSSKDVKEKTEQTYAGSAGVLSTLTNQGGSRIAVCAGIGGVGKTQLALHVLQTQKATLKAWFPAEKTDQLQDKYHDLAKELGFVSDKPDIEAAKRYLKQWLATNPGWLLVFDNANHYTEIESFLPETGGSILITTRDPLWPPKMQVIPVPILQGEEGIKFVQALSEQHAPEIAKLVEILGGLPLALAQASAYIKLYRKTVSEYLKLYAAHSTELLADKTLPLGTEHAPVAITWNTSLEAIEKNPEGKYARILMTVCSYLAPESIPRTLLFSWLKNTYPETSDLMLDKLLGQLQSHSLLEITEQGIVIHRLMQTVLAWQHQQTKLALPEYPKLSQEWYSLLLKVIDNEFNKKTQVLENEARQKTLFTHLQSLLLHFDALWPKATPNLALGNLLSNVGNVFSYLKGSSRLALPLYERALKIEEAHYGKEHPNVAIILGNLGNAYGALGDAKQQKELLERALKIQEAHYGKEHSQVAVTLCGLAEAYTILKQPELAYPLAERGHAIWLKAYGTNHPHTKYAESLKQDCQQMLKNIPAFTTAAQPSLVFSSTAVTNNTAVHHNSGGKSDIGCQSSCILM